MWYNGSVAAVRSQERSVAFMKSRLTIQECLKDLHKEKDIKLEKLEELTGIFKSALGSYKENNYKEINYVNLVMLAYFYGMSVDYLLCQTENRKLSNTPLAELHLSNEMVELLKAAASTIGFSVRLLLIINLSGLWPALKFT